MTTHVSVPKFIAIVIVALTLAGLGSYVLLELRSLWGVALVLGALCIAFPATMRRGAQDVKDNAGFIVPAIMDVKVGGARWSDPKTPPPSAMPTHLPDPVVTEEHDG